MARVPPDAAGFDPRLAWPLRTFLAVLFALPLALLAGLSLHGLARLGLSQYAKFLADAFSLGVLGGTMRLGAEVTLACLALRLPLAVAACPVVTHNARATDAGRAAAADPRSL